MLQPDKNLQAKTKEYYDSGIIPEWLSFVYNDLATSTHFPFGAARELVVRAARKDRESRGLKAYDLGCGGGQLSVVLANLGFDVAALDFSATMLDEAKALIQKHNLTDRVSFRQSDFERDPLGLQTPDGSYAIAMGFIEYLADTDAFFAKAAHFLLPQGQLLVEFRNRAFNAVTGNRFTLADAETGALANSVDAFQEFCGSAAVTAKHYDEYSDAMAAAHRVSSDSRPPATQTLSEFFPVARRQHLLQEVRSSATANGFDVVDVYGLHPHPFVPGLESHQSWHFNQIAWQLQQYPKNPLVISTCSSLAVLFVRR
jgi:2-polyprenyl-3-methyl-5-hydroxy-6-metoxy-1,4-benzoquinol methylase